MSAGNISGNGLIKRGQPKTSSGTQQYGVPGVMFSSQSTNTPNVGEIRYRLMFVENPITLTTAAFEVTTAPASAANVRIGIYAADGNQQPVGATLYDVEVPVASGFTGVKTATITSLSLPKGVYLVATNIDVAMTVRLIISPTYWVGGSLGASALTNSFLVTEAYGTFKTPGTLWTSRAGGTTGQSNIVFFKWTE